jgi:IS30 family transposase
MGYRHITEKERYQIYALLKAITKPAEIARILKRHPSTISREVKRNKGLRGYRPKQAHEKATQRASSSRTRVRIALSAWREVECQLQQEHSPEQISGRLKRQGIFVSPEWIYQYIYHDKAQGGTLHEHLRCQKKRRKRYASGYSRRGQIPDQVRISERPEVVSTKSRIGDWEGDTVIGKGHKGAIVSLVERRSQRVRLRLVKQKDAATVRKAIAKCLSLEAAHTLTLDNGKEFSEHKRLSNELGTDIYFADPYASWQRGLNEHINGLIRQYLPKSTDFTQLTHWDIKRIENRLNNRPRKTLGFKTPNEVYFS